MITVDAPKLKEVERQLGNLQSRAPSVLARAINRAAQNAKTNMSKKVREQYIVKASDVKKTVNLVRANKSMIGALVKSTGYKVPLSKFKMNPKNPKPKRPPKAYKAQVKKSSNPKPISRGFVANIGGTNKFMRRTGKSRLPIEQLFGPSIPEMIGQKDVVSYIEKDARATLDKRIEHEIDRALGVN